MILDCKSSRAPQSSAERPVDRSLCVPLESAGRPAVPWLKRAAHVRGGEGRPTVSFRSVARSHARRASALLLACAATVLILLPSSSMAAGAVACGPSWTTVPSSSAVTDPRGIAVVSASDVWIVGSQLTGTASKVHTAAEHWNGTAWTLVATPNSGLGENNLNGVSAVSAGDVWAVGYWQPQKKTDAAFHTLTEHWDGTAWSIVPSPTVGGNSNTLTGVAA